VHLLLAGEMQRKALNIRKRFNKSEHADYYTEMPVRNGAMAESIAEYFYICLSGCFNALLLNA
jgi:hypothetical protein